MRRYVLPLIWCLALPGHLAAQGAANGSAIPTMACDEAREIVLKSGGPREQDIRWATHVVLRCGEGRGSILRRALRTAPPGTVRDSAVRYAVWIFDDTSLVSTVIAMARDRQEPVDRRRWAVAMLTRYLAPSGFGLWLEVEPGKRTLVRYPGGGEVLGTYPWEPADRARLVETVRWVGRHDPDPALRKLARQIGEQL